MLDDLRNSASQSSGQTPDQAPFQDLNRQRQRPPFLGMSAVQRFVLALLLFLMSCVLGAGCLILTGKVYLPFF